MSSTYYVALIHKAKRKGADYGVIFPDFPGCVFGGQTLEQALENARDGILFHIEGMLGEGEALPHATSLETIQANAHYAQGTPFLIRVLTPTGHLKRLNISMDANLVAAIDLAARRLGKNRSEFLSDVARQMLA